MSALFFKRFLKRPFQIASIVPSSKALVDRVADKVDFERARVIAEYGPGEGVHSRELARRMRPDTQLLLFELDAAFSRDLQRQFAGDPRVHVIYGDAATLSQEMQRRVNAHGKGLDGRDVRAGVCPVRRLDSARCPELSD